MTLDICQKGSGTEELVIDCDTLPSLEELGILQVGKARAQMNYRMYRFQPNFHMLLFTHSGRGLLNGTDNFCLTSDTLMFIPSGYENEFLTQEAPWSFSWLMLDASGRWQSLADEPAWLKPTRYTTLVDHTVEGIYQTAKHQEDRKLLRLQAKQLAQICDLSLQTEHGAPPAQLRLLRLFDYIDKRLEQHWSLDRMANHIHYSVPHLVRQCRQWLGTSPNKKLIQLRMARASSLLATTNTAISQIALAVGYDEPANFSAAFKHYTGTTPSQFRRRQQQKTSV